MKRVIAALAALVVGCGAASEPAGDAGAAVAVGDAGCDDGSICVVNPRRTACTCQPEPAP